ncbi:GNAT family N-acetyltransferase [Cesiribacter sp. SM1]|uniref:GNAT family N-acetyltransferase n=1 Tax=Cesiribacter sp. SM1 TaxID=2861196 RepID=UPI001CD4EDAB|nr:GNAT family N-acetyltransferase [Cesiribacter sp. SM1]
MVQVKQVANQQQLDAAFEIRRKVFVVEQEVPAEEEYDEFEESSRHFLAYTAEGLPCGTARWRYTPKGIKLERFAVLGEQRGKGAGAALVQKVLDDISSQPDADGKTLYLHAQITAMPLYSKFGFKPDGPEFLECGIRHYLMKK